MGTYKANKNDSLNFEDIPEKTEQEKKQESTEKLVDLAGETALDYFTGGQFSQAKGAIEKVPIAGKVVNNTWDNAVKRVSKQVSNTPIGDVAKAADETGLTDTARKAKNMINIKDGKASISGDSLSNSALNKTSDIGDNINNNGGSSSGNSLKSSNSSKSNGFMDFINGSDGSFFSKLPVGVKIKLIVGLGAVFLFFLICFAVFASDDNKNLSLTNNSTMISKGISTNSGEVLSRLEELAMFFIDNAGEYNQSAYLYVPALDTNVRKDCSGFAVAYMSYVSGVLLPTSSTSEMVDINSSWAKTANSAGWQAFTAEEVGDVSNLKPGDVLVERGHTEIYVGPNETFGWGQKQSKYPLSKTMVNTSTGNKVRFGDGYHSDYKTIYRFMNANLEVEDTNIETDDTLNNDE